MSRPFPYTYISCPCADTPVPETLTEVAREEEEEEEEEEEGGGTFNPRSPRANFSLFPPEHLLYCEECHEIKCPRCVMEEIVSWYCPNCLFETPSSTVRSEGNRWVLNSSSLVACLIGKLLIDVQGIALVAPSVPRRWL